MPTIAILIFPGVQALDVSGPMDVFAEANSFLPPERQYRIEVLGTQEGLLRCSNGLCLAAHRHYAQAHDAYDLLLVAGGPGLPAQPVDADLSAWLASAAGKARRHGSICNGAFLLGHAGLLDGKKVATHWNDAAALAARFPLAQVDADSIYVHDGNLVSSAGVTAGIDLSLSLLAEAGGVGGAQLALQVARRLVVYTQRQGGQSQFSPYLTPVVDAASPVAQAQQYVLAHLGEVLDVDTLARLVAMSPRNFARVFVRELGVTPAQFIESARLDAARALLEASSDPLKTVAWRCGFGTADQLRTVFLRRLGVSAKQYRQHFSSYRQG
ncbi:AraC family transcriptional regulator [Janthinobacterium lividum]|uniref:GlxA family transcriptional regulator n=1 Tax=Janthinobacterium lividum TaxID=29581 RepID=UPI00053824B1|nr:DJ-1/PfpI family protein [Janthinobacterium lividum]KHA78981.1 AraC family transcriptional regulator [Janthinobacterium lividum]QKY02134.1 helix-turn-helix domain-containing protein [Janthinobacterium lividum]